MRHGRAAAEGVVGEGGGQAAVVGDWGKAIEGIVGVIGDASRVDHGSAVAVEIVSVDGIDIVQWFWIFDFGFWIGEQSEIKISMFSF